MNITQASSDAQLLDGAIELLDEQDCRRLLALRRIGRIGISIGALPAIMPVHYLVVDGDVVFLTSEGTKLRAALDNTIVAFEVDDVDEEEEVGWSVLIVGRASELDAPEAAQLDLSSLPTWPAGSRRHVVRVRPEFVSGRRLCRV